MVEKFHLKKVAAHVDNRVISSNTVYGTWDTAIPIKMLCGGTTEARQPTQEDIVLIKKIQTDVEKKTGKSYKVFEPVSVKTQVVAGTNYFSKVKVDVDCFIHVRIWQTLQESLELHGVMENKTLDDPLEYFQQ